MEGLFEIVHVIFESIQKCNFASVLLISSTSGANARTVSKRAFWSSFVRLLVPTQESAEINASGTHFAHF